MHASARFLLPLVAAFAWACTPTVESEAPTGTTGTGHGGHQPHGTGVGAHPPDGVGGYSVTSTSSEGGWYPDGSGGYTTVSTGSYPDGSGGWHTSGTGGAGGWETSGVGGSGGWHTSGVGGSGGWQTSGVGGSGGWHTSGVGGSGGWQTSGVGGSGGWHTSGVGSGGWDTSSGVGGSGGWFTSGVGGGGPVTTVTTVTTSTHVSVGAGGASPGFCGGDTGAQCASNDYCDYANGSCGEADQGGQCRSRPFACSGPVGQPVCACDGLFYEDKCHAHLAGVDAAADAAFCAPDPAYFGCGDEVCSASQYCFSEPSIAFAACNSFPGCTTCDCLAATCQGGVCTTDAAGHLTLACP